MKITKIMPHGAYCQLIEYELDAYLPISEIASGWIKNIHEFVKEGQKDVAKVIAVDRVKGSVDVSLKKAHNKERADKLSDYNIEKRSEMLFNQALKLSHNEDKAEKIKEEIAKKTNTYTEVLNNILANKDYLAYLKNKPFADALSDTVQKNTKPKRYEVSYLVELRAADPHAGVSAIKRAFGEIEKLGVTVLYIGAPRYRLTVEDSSYPKAEEHIKAARTILESNSKAITFTMKSEKHD